MSFSRKKPRKKPIVFFATRGSVSVCGEIFNGSCRAEKDIFPYVGLHEPIGFPRFSQRSKVHCQQVRCQGSDGFRAHRFKAVTQSTVRWLWEDTNRCKLKIAQAVMQRCWFLPKRDFDRQQHSQGQISVSHACTQIVSISWFSAPQFVVLTN
jgi:hypothetical protein